MNKMYGRTGPLFESPVKRILVEDEHYFSMLVTYIHQNPQKHGIVDNYKDYPYSSYHTHLHEGRITKLSREDVLEWFGGQDGYSDFHRNQNISAKAIPPDFLSE